MTFEQLCTTLRVTPEEQQALAEHLAAIRAKATLKAFAPKPGDAVMAEVLKWALAGHISEAGITVEAGKAIRAAADGVSGAPHQPFSPQPPMPRADAE